MKTPTMNKETGQTRESRLIETDAFDFEFLSELGERESWRKEVYRPIYHMHKWWANRLGSVFRGIILGALLPERTNLREAFYLKHDFSAISIFDPFMGSGTTVGEAHKLGCAALGRDINPVACESVRVAFGTLDRIALLAAFSQLASTVAEPLLNLYRSRDEFGHLCDVLYYFWVKQAPCPHCGFSVDLFSSRIMARNAYPQRRPEIHISCPTCGCIFSGKNDDERARCPVCGVNFDPRAGNTRGAEAACSDCHRSFSVAKAVRSTGHPPAHRLYGKLLLRPDGQKVYLSADDGDIESYQSSRVLLQHDLEIGTIRLPDAPLSHGYNTRQAINYNYREWRDFFNERQLLALGWLQEGIAALPDTPSRDALFLLFSGVLEFNNLFASYKGEGTGAVRHMFAHHILKPERMPIEANVWGTPKSSGSFASLFKTRLLRAVDYRTAPFEVKAGGSGKNHYCSLPFSGKVSAHWPSDGCVHGRGIYLSCGSSDDTGLQHGSVDFVITDPPFFDNVHYSELADFFYSWQTQHPRGFITKGNTTRQKAEVQDTRADSFARKLTSVFRESRRVLRPDGLLIFTYHHSRSEGWASLVEAIYDAGFSVVNAHPVKAEMSVATPKTQAKEPIQLDIVFVCRPKENDLRIPDEQPGCIELAAGRAAEKLARLRTIGLSMSLNDCRIVIISQFICSIGPVPNSAPAVLALLNQKARLDEEALRVFAVEDNVQSDKAIHPQEFEQMTLIYEPGVEVA
jgi:putative DNA methylase